MIFLSHTTSFNHLPDSLQLGSFGVSIFITLSGFLEIAYSSRHNTVNKTEGLFYLRDKLRHKFKNIYPLHITMMIIALPYAIWSVIIHLHTVQFLAVAVLLNVAMLHGFIPVEEIYFSINEPSWYLSIFLLIVIIGSYLSNVILEIADRIGTILLVFLLFGVEIIWTLLFQNNASGYWLIYINPFFRMVDFCIGVCIGQLFKMYKEYLSLNKILKLSILVFIATLVSNYYLGESVYNVFSMTAIYIPADIILIFCFFLMGEKFKDRNIIITKFGNVSMEVFLIHSVVIRYVGTLLGKAGLNDIVYNNIFIGLLMTGICLIITVFASGFWRMVVNVIRKY